MNSTTPISSLPVIIILSLALFLSGCSSSDNSSLNEASDQTNVTSETTTGETSEGPTDEAGEPTAGDTSDDAMNDVDVTEPTLELVADKTVRLTWGAREGALSYRVFENPDGVAGFSPISEVLDNSTFSFEHRVALYLRVNASYLVQICYAMDCVNSEPRFMTGTLDDAVGYVKASNAEGGYLSPGQQEAPAVIGGDRFGSSVSLSNDGKTLAVSAPREDSSAFGVNGSQDDNTDLNSGAVYVFVRNNERWQQQVYLKADGPGRRCCLGGDAVLPKTSLSLSGDGNTLAVGAYSYNFDEPGEVYVFTRSGEVWEQQASVEASFSTDAEGDAIVNGFGASVSLTLDGDTLVVGAPSEQSAATGVNGNQNDSSVVNAGAAYVFERNNGEWQEQAYLKASNTGRLVEFGSSVVISADGSTIAVGALGESSIASGILVRPSSEEVMQEFSNNNAGAAYVFAHNGGGWQQQAFIKSSNPEVDDRFGEAVTLSADGNILAVAASGDDNFAGAVYVFTRNSGDWDQQEYLKAGNNGLAPGAQFGSAISISADGSTLAIGASGEAGFSNGINGDQFAVLPRPGFGQSDGALSIGAAYVFTRSSNDWTQVAYVKGTNNTPDIENIGIGFGESVSLSGDGQTLAVGTSEEAGGVSGINTDRFDSSAPGAGAVFVY